MDQYQQDELAQLFAQNMHLSQHNHNQPRAMSPSIEPLPIVTDKPKPEEPITYASAHYTHSAHIVLGDSRSEPSRSPPPPYHEAAMPEGLAELLLQYSINPYALQSNQIELFMNAGDEQRMRLLELWRIAPPSYPKGDGTSSAQHLRGRSSSISGAYRNAEAEPYIVNGYEAEQSMHSVDPVYAATYTQWPSPCHAQTVCQPQDNYHYDYSQIRNHADWERLNEQIMRERFAAVDDEMVM